MPDTTVKCFTSTMSGAPSLTRTAGSLITLLNACLQNGFGLVTLASLVVSGNVATGTVTAGHNFAMLGAVGPVLKIEGATPSGLNGQWRVTVTSSTQFTFATSGITDQTATGTITAKRAPLGFTQVYNDTNKAAYQADALDSTRFYLRVDDTGTNAATVQGYVTMSDINTGTEGFPSSAPYFYKIDNIQSSAPWWLIGDDRSFYLISQTNSNGIASGGLFFGDFSSPISYSDSYAAGLIGGPSNSNSYLLDVTGTTNAAIPRSYTQQTGVTSFYRYTHSRLNALAYPCPVNNGILVAPVEAWESSYLPRGMMPGMYRSLNVYSSYTNLAVFDNVLGLSRSLIYFLGANQGSLFDLTGPWR